MGYVLKRHVIHMPHPQNTCYWTLRPFVLPVSASPSRSSPNTTMTFTSQDTVMPFSGTHGSLYLYDLLDFIISYKTLKHWHQFNSYFALFSYRFIAERGEGGQLIHVEKIDDAYHLKPLTGAATENVRSVPSSYPERPLSLLSGKPRYSVFHGQTLDFNILYKTQNYPLL